MIDLMIVAKKWIIEKIKIVSRENFEKDMHRMLSNSKTFFFFFLGSLKLCLCFALYPFVRFVLAVLILISHQIEAFGLSCLTLDLYETVYDHFRTESKQITRSHAYP